MVKTSLQCEACSYKFRRNIVPKLCPHCGKDSVVEDKRMAAEEILRELDDMSDGFY